VQNTATLSHTGSTSRGHGCVQQRLPVKRSLCYTYFTQEYYDLKTSISQVYIQVQLNDRHTLTDGLLARASIMPHSAACGATPSLLIEPTQGFLISDLAFGATLAYAVLGMCQKISSGILQFSGNSERTTTPYHYISMMNRQVSVCFSPDKKTVASYCA
jgi:hypothetical protein